MGPAGVLVFVSVFVEIGCALRAFSCFCACTPDDHCDSETQTSARTATKPTTRRDSLILMMRTPGKGIQACEEYCKARKEQRTKSEGIRAKRREMKTPNELSKPPPLLWALGSSLF